VKKEGGVVKPLYAGGRSRLPNEYGITNLCPQKSRERKDETTREGRQTFKKRKQYDCGKNPGNCGAQFLLVIGRRAL